MRKRFLTIVLATLVGACSSSDAREIEEQQDSRGVARTVVDSIFPPEEALRRFRADLPRVAALEGGAESRDALVAHFISAVETHDTTTVRHMLLSKGEFAWTYYPTSVFSREPYYQMPQLNWFLNIESSLKGITRAMERFGGSDLQYAGFECPDSARADGGMRFWDGCLVNISHEGARKHLRLFGSIVEFRGRYKFYSYANDL